jgi:hypothetical protein
MKDINGLATKALELNKKVERSLKELYGTYQELSKVASAAFNEQLVENKGKISGLEDFYQMTQTIKKNNQLVGASLGAMSRVGDISDFKITVEESKPIEKLKSDKMVKNGS